jgi:hypothetical protein
MTTIAWDGFTLATDSQGTLGDNKSGSVHKKLFKNIGPFRAVALSGELRAFPKVLKSFKTGDVDETKFEVVGICVDKHGVAWEFDGFHWTFQKMRPLTAMGTGWALATAAMQGGADAHKALKITCKLDLYSGGRIQKFTVV